MKKKLIIAALSMIGICGFAQDGMDYNGSPGNHWSCLRYPNGNPFSPGGNAINNNFSERALGVYQTKGTPPASFLEVNTNNSHMPYPLVGLGLGEVFSTNAGGATSFWRMKRQTNEFGALFNVQDFLSPDDHLGIQASRPLGDMIFYTGGNNERMRINDSGYVMVGRTTALRCSPGAVPDFKFRFSVDAGNDNAIIGGLSNGTQPRIYFETTNPAIQNMCLGHTVPGPLTPNVTSCIMWNNVDYPNWESDIHINTRSPLGLLPGGNALSITQGFGRVGIRNINPANRLEITSLLGPGNDPKPAGLRFTNLTCASPTEPQCVPATPVFLSVDNNGDVILVDGAISSGTANCCVGNYCSSKFINPLTDNYRIPLNSFNIYYPGQGFHGAFPSTTDAIGIGYDCVDKLPAKLSVIQDNSLPGGLGLAPESTNGGSFINRDISSGNFKIMTGIDAKSDAIQNPALNIRNIGGSFFASNSSTNTAVQGRTGGALPPSGTNFAGHFTTGGPGLNTYGVFARGVGASANNYGIWAEAGGGTNSYAIYASNPTSACSPNHWAGYFDGDVNINGCGAYALTVNGSAFLSSGTLWTTSDKNYKRDFKKLENINDKIKKLNGYTYYFKTAEFPDKKFETTEQIGLIAQELKEVFPQLVTTDDKGYMAVNYQGMVPVLLEAVKEQQKQIDELKTLVENSVVTNPNGGEQKTIGSVNLADIQSIILDQNVPNPFAEQTTISYTLTKDVQKAQMLFYNEEGKLINSSELKTTQGKGQLNVFANDLSNGIYTYTLVVDGKIIDSKRMVKSK